MIIIASYSNVSVTYTADGTQTVFSFPFDYLRKAFVYVEIDATTVLENGEDYVVSEKTVVFTEAPVEGTVLRIYRQTDTTPLVSWADASVLRAKDMTVQQIQELHILEEQEHWMEENAFVREGNYWNARGFRIQNVGDPTDSKDAANKDYVDDTFAEISDQLDDLGEAVEIATEAKEAAEEAAERAEDAYMEVKDKASYYNNVNEVKAATGLLEGMVAVTKGYTSVNDGGGATYLIRAKTASDVNNYDNFTLNNGLFAERIFGNNFEIANGSSVRNWKVYTTASSLGLNYETMNIDQVFRALPPNSMAILHIVSQVTNFLNYPNNGGVLFVRKSKISNSSIITHCVFKGFNNLRKWEGTFFGEYNAENPQLSDYTWTGWTEVSARPIDMPRNPQRCVDEMIEVADSYHGKGIVYGTQSAGKDTGSIAGFSGEATDMNCKLFVLTVLEGIPYHLSKWYNQNYPLRYRNSYPWATHPPSNWFDFIKWCWRNGWEVDPGINYGNLQKGDIVFWGKTYDRWGSTPHTGEDGYEEETQNVQNNYENGVYTETNTTFWKSYREVEHVGIVTGRWRTDPQGNKQPEIIQCTGWRASLPPDGTYSGAIRYDYIGSLTIPQHAAETLVMYIRIPLCQTKAFSTMDYDRVALNRSILHSYYHKANLTIKGNGQNIYIDICTRNKAAYSEIEIGAINTATGEDLASTTRIRTGFIQRSGSIEETIPTGFSLVATDYYDKDKAFLGQSFVTGAEYIRKVFKKTDGSAVSSTELNTFKNGYIIVNSGEYATYERGFSQSIKIASSVIGNGYVCKRHNGVYCKSNNGFNWTPLDSTTQNLLETVYLYDGENHIRVINNQDIEIL